MAGVFPTFGEFAYANTDGTPTEWPAVEPGVKYYSDWASWSLPHAIYNVAGKFIVVYFNTHWNQATSTFSVTGECRFVTPTSPPTLSVILEFWSDSTVSADSGIGMWDQHQMSHCVIGTDLYLQFGAYKGRGATVSTKGVFCRIDCSGAVPVLGALVEEPAVQVSEYVIEGCVTYVLAAINQQCIAFPMYTKDLNVPVRRLDANLSTVWSDTTWNDSVHPLSVYSSPALRRSEIPYVAHSDTSQSWLMNWYQDFIAFDVTPTGLAFIGTVGPLVDTSVNGVISVGDVTLFYTGQIDNGIAQTTVSLYPATRSGLQPNGMLISNFGYLSWHLWYDGGFQHETQWLFDFSDPVDPAAGIGFGFHYNNGTSYTYILGNTSESIITILPLFTNNLVSNVFMNMGYDVIPEEQVASFPGGKKFDISSWTQSVVAVVQNGLGILLMSSAYPTDELDTYYYGGTAGAGKIMLIPFTLGAPDIDGGIIEQRRKFWRPKPGW